MRRLSRPRESRRIRFGEQIKALHARPAIGKQTGRAFLPSGRLPLHAVMNKHHYRSPESYGRCIHSKTSSVHESKFPQSEIDWILSRMKMRVLEPGEAFCRMGDERHEMGLLFSGLLRVFTIADDGSEATLDFVLPVEMAPRSMQRHQIRHRR